MKSQLVNILENTRVVTLFRHANLNVIMNGEKGLALPGFPL